MAKTETVPKWLLYALLPFFIGSVAFGIHSFVKARGERVLGMRSLEWWQAAATVMRCDRHPGYRNRSESATVTYRYVVRGQPYFSDRVTVASESVTENVQAFVDGHPVGTLITAYYNPENPKDAVINPGIDKLNAFNLTFSAVMTVGSAIFFILVIGDLVRQRKNAGRHGFENQQRVRMRV
jgi:hypothetical protein